MVFIAFFLVFNDEVVVKFVIILYVHYMVRALYKETIMASYPCDTFLFDIQTRETLPLERLHEKLKSSIYGHLCVWVIFME